MVSQSSTLQRRVESGHLDVALVKDFAGGTRGRLVRRDRLVWAAVARSRGVQERPVPLVMYHAPSGSRSRATQALDEAGIGYRITCTVRDVTGLLAAVRAELGITTFASSLVPEDLVEVPPSAGLPELGEIDLVLLTNPRSPAGPVNALSTAILASVNPIRGMR